MSKYAVPLRAAAFPDDYSGLPTTHREKNNSYIVDLQPLSNGGVRFSGKVRYRASGGEERWYLFEAASHPTRSLNVIVSAAPPWNINSFDDRDGIGRSLRSLSGFAPGHRRDLKEYVQRVVEYELGSFQAEQAFLLEAFMEGTDVPEAHSRS